ncbi:response regulator transcription factor [Suttonella sp. R2A3]|uniref:response regulator n=1 Tax=Suttonella sp. R2A3 TaxID=2908648 RepID=UPI001F40BFC4|nr:response regulator transcription factor [Suttonella sp. R2A3]UJF25226.1 response regulator transcription factor [Suttonella sp. R2A3]
MNKPLVKIVLIDDHALFRQGLRFLLIQEPEFTVIGEAANGVDGVALITTCQPDIVLLDLDMPDINGLQTLIRISEVCPELPVLILTISENAADLQKCLSLGAKGYVLKNADTSFLINAIRRIMAGDKVLSPDMVSHLVEELHPAESVDRLNALSALTRREVEVLHYIARGISNKAIAAKLSLSENTIKVHVQNILKKLNLRSRVQAAVFANQYSQELPNKL